MLYFPKIRLGIRFESVLDPFGDPFSIRLGRCFWDPTQQAPALLARQTDPKQILQRIPQRTPNGPPDGPCGGSPNHASLEGDALLIRFGSVCRSVFDPFRICLGIRLQIRFGVPPGLGPKRIPKQIPKRIQNGSKTHSPMHVKRIIRLLHNNPVSAEPDFHNLTVARASAGMMRRREVEGSLAASAGHCPS